MVKFQTQIKKSIITNKSKTIAVRANANTKTGIGHLKRCLRLAEKLKILGYETIFILDKIDSKLIIDFGDFKYFQLYTDGANFKNELADAVLFLELIEDYRPIAVIVDDYRISKDWETLIKKEFPLFVLDDENNRFHNCDILIDSNWRGDETYDRYLGLTPKNTIRLLGPKYIILSDTQDANITTSLINTRINDPSLVISFGGGGDMRELLRLVKSIFENRHNKFNIPIRVIIGPYTINSEYILAYASLNKQVIALKGLDNLDNVLSKSSLYIGAAGTTLYEALTCKLPCITFSLADNQKYIHKYLEDIGHYFHFNDYYKLSLDSLAEFIWISVDNIERVTSLYLKNPKVQIDRNGAARIADSIDAFLKSNSKEINVAPSQFNLDLHVKNNEESSEYIFVSIDDTFINKYLEARYLSKNDFAITKPSKINLIEHYMWWFNNNRSIFVLQKGALPCVYCWHEVKDDPFKIIIGGFFAANPDSTGLEIIKAVFEHHKLTDLAYPNIAWYAFTSNKNVYADFVNKRVGFKVIKGRSQYLPIFGRVFKNIDFSNYILYIKKYEKNNF
jgi:UDP-2,4-diacetamido-2,4,6-trideoxy-beta-L-altropyranose hydrolase